MFLINSYETEHKNNLDKTSNTIGKQYSATMIATLQSNSTHNDKISFAVSKFLKENYENKSFRPFREVRSLGKKFIESEYDEDIDFVTFKPAE